MKERRTYRLVVPHYVCAVITDKYEGKVVIAAPIARWTIGKSIVMVRQWAESKGGSCELLER